MTTDTLTHHEHHAGSIAVFGFWVFLLSDFILFATLFTSYVVLRNHTFGSIDVRQTAGLSYVLVESLILLTACLTYGFVSSCAKKGQSTGGVLFWLLVTFLLGLAFIGMQVHLLGHIMAAGYSWHNSAFLSIFFLLIAMHGLHLIIGLLWCVVLFLQLMHQGLTPVMKTRLICLGYFWVFLNIIWVFIFTVVFLMGAI